MITLTTLTTLTTLNVAVLLFPLAILLLCAQRVYAARWKKRAEGLAERGCLRTHSIQVWGGRKEKKRKEKKRKGKGKRRKGKEKGKGKEEKKNTHETREEETADWKDRRGFGLGRMDGGAGGLPWRFSQCFGEKGVSPQDVADGK